MTGWQRDLFQMENKVHRAMRQHNETVIQHRTHHPVADMYTRSHRAREGARQTKRIKDFRRDEKNALNFAMMS